MTRWAQIQGGIVANVVEQDSTPTIGGQWVECTGQPVGPGHGWDGSTWTAPAAMVPAVVSMRQARRALRAAGLLSTVDAAIAGMSEPARTNAQIDWDYSSEVQRDNATLAALAAALGLTGAQVDALFVAAAAIA